MRNLKKTLCLVLALVFVMGLCTVGVGAVNGTDFDDQDTINYSTAVKAMSGLGILKGDDNDGDGKTEFRPSDNVTRAEAAKIIAYIVVGEEVEKWPARQAFDDVPADHWAAKYITYCQYNNIINGYGNGKFGPNDPVTQAQLAKMLLSACGYGAKGEFVGEGWDQNVAKVAFQTKILKGILSTDWDAPATREETALLGYNTMMNAVQVVVDKDTDSYTPVFVNGVQNVTFSQSTWELIPVKGIVFANKANDYAAKGTNLYVTECKDDPTLVSTFITLETEDDENADVLGHEVTVSYREEGVAPNVKYVAYYIDDACQEVTGAAANTANYADVTVDIDDGDVSLGLTEPVGIGKNTRYRDTAAIYVLNEEGKLVGRKTTSYNIYPLSIDPGTGIASANYQEVKAPEGAKTGDMVTVYKCGNIYTAKACTKQEKVAITQRVLVEYDKNFDGTMDAWSFSYNNGQYVPSKATNMPGKTGPATGGLVLTSINAIGITNTYYTKPALDAELRVGYSYTLFFDAEGGVYASADPVETSAAAIPEYVMFVKNVTLTTGYGTETVNAVQVIKADGTVANLPVQTHDTTLAMGNICTNKADTENDGKRIVAKLATVPAVEGDVGGVWNAAYLPNDPTFDFSDAKFIYYNGLTESALAVTTGAAAGKPAVQADKPASVISYTCRIVKVGTALVKKIDTVWFSTKPSVVVTYNAANYIYVVNADVKDTRVVDGATVNFWNGYKDGEKMDDLRLGVGKTGAIGFYKFSLKDGVYTLLEVPAGDGTATGYRTVYLKDGLSENILMGTTLYVPDKNGIKQAIDLSNVKVVRVPNGADKTSSKPLVIDSVTALQSVLMSTDKYQVTVSFVEVIDPTTKAHTAGGGVIYVTEVK